MNYNDIKILQKKIGAVADGIPGSETFDKIEKYYNSNAAQILQKYVFDDEECIAQDMKDYNEALKMAIEALQKDIERHEMVIQARERHLGIVRCKDCKWYQGVHGVQGHAPCEWFNKQVLWSDFCSNGEPYKGGDTE